MDRLLYEGRAGSQEERRLASPTGRETKKKDRHEKPSATEFRPTTYRKQGLSLSQTTLDRGTFSGGGVIGKVQPPHTRTRGHGEARELQRFSPTPTENIHTSLIPPTGWRRLGKQPPTPRRQDVLRGSFKLFSTRQPPFTTTATRTNSERVNTSPLEVLTGGRHVTNC